MPSLISKYGQTWEDFKNDYKNTVASLQDVTECMEWRKLKYFNIRRIVNHTKNNIIYKRVTNKLKYKNKRKTFIEILILSLNFYFD